MFTHRLILKHLTTEPILCPHSVTWHLKAALKFMVKVSLLFLTHFDVQWLFHLHTIPEKTHKANLFSLDTIKSTKKYWNRYNFLLFSSTASTKSPFNQLKRFAFKTSAIKSHHHQNNWRARADIGRQNKRNKENSFEWQKLLVLPIQNKARHTQWAHAKHVNLVIQLKVTTFCSHPYTSIGC